jgi:hypothetical protein
MENYLCQIKRDNADKILSSAATVRSADFETTSKEGEKLVSTLDKSPPSTLGVDPPEPLNLLPNSDDTQ